MNHLHPNTEGTANDNLTMAVNDNDKDDDTETRSSSWKVSDPLHDLRLDLRRLEPSGILGNVLLWWLYPTKFLADPVLEMAERVLVPAVTAHIPFARQVLECGLGATATAARAVYGILHNTTGLVSSNASLENVTTMSQLQALREQSQEIKQQLLKTLSDQAQQKQSLLSAAQKSVVRTVTKQAPDLLERLYQGYSYLYQYGYDAKMFEQVRGMGHLRYAENKALLGVIQQHQQQHRRRVEELLIRNHDPMKRILLEQFPLSEACYYSKFAMAAYGDHGILHQHDEHLFDWRKGEMTAFRISEHTGIPVQDLVLLDSTTTPKQHHVHHLPNFIALDHGHGKIIWAIRGTYTRREVMIDFDGYSRPFLGGEAHSAISVMAERMWWSLGDDIVRRMDTYPTYELIVTGHSLGGGCACLLNLLLHRDVRVQGRTWRVFTYGSPPVYVPSFANIVSSQRDVRTCINYINQYDAVPFMSGDSVRHQIAMIAAIQKADLDLGLRARLLLLGLDDRPAETTALAKSRLLETIAKIQRKPLPPKQGCPRHMAVPAVGNVWMLPDPSDDSPVSFHVVIADSLKMSEAGILIHKNDLTDHLPARYEYVLQRTK